ncbi:esterase [Synechococcus sp. MIT S9509]|uniref:S9 family peptidase n=1 Tax=unclassified Synechococcus TaxID=2626047 RepID=UPI0007BAEC96|nr:MULTISPECIES: prolyl oligopeptidase family serine peptidase [unclassified Synechococcus]KZR84738.1 esterase [Synechococcus sp. MIT S9504]KZR89850.1 esterase [Synechococcus sp. MIT S9509]
MSSSQPLSARTALGRQPVLKTPRVLGNWVLWLEQRPQEKGRTTAMIRPWLQSDQPAKELTAAPANLRCRIHEYGGGAMAVALMADKLLMTWIDDCDRCLWQQTWCGLRGEHCAALTAETPPIRISAPGAWALGGGLIDQDRQRWLGVMECEGRDHLVSVGLNQGEQQPLVLHAADDFVGYPALSADGKQLAWVEWRQPAMPWDASELRCASLTSEGELLQVQTLAGSRPDAEQAISVFQPLWQPDGSLVVAEDSSGWWNLMRLGDPAGGKHNWERPWPMQAETAMPQWVFGMSTSAWDGEQLLAAICSEGRWELKQLRDDGTIRSIDQPFDDLADLHADAGRAVVIASSSHSGQGLLELELSSGDWQHTPAGEAALPIEAISSAEPLWFEGAGKLRTHAWYYPPLGGASSDTPLLVKSHSGPTAMAGRGLSLGIQFWTTRGWGVVDVNYGGSTGFGRAYRDRLDGSWGVVDVKDCAAAAMALVEAGHADPQRIAIEGGSAGGFTTLACLCFTDVFRAGACRYAVSDLTSLASETHRFEARYLDSLVGAWPEARARYEQRSPLQHAQSIGCPVIFFQGLQDKVVVPEQTERMAAALSHNGIPVEVQTFAEEGHGFRDSAVKVQVLEATEAFFRRHLGL